MAETAVRPRGRIASGERKETPWAGSRVRLRRSVRRGYGASHPTSHVNDEYCCIEAPWTPALRTQGPDVCSFEIGGADRRCGSGVR